MAQKSPKLVCDSVWKIYGTNTDAVTNGDAWPPSDDDLARHGLIGAVREASLDIYDGEIFVIMGLSGSGKSTLVRCMSRLIESSSGKILFNGEDLLQKSAAEMIKIRRHKMGMVFQHFALLPHLTVLENIAFPLDVQGISRGEREERVRPVIELVGLGGRENYFPRELSGGQQQRVGIARSLAIEPELWFLDEPFSALDPLIRREMQDEFLRLQSVLKKTIIFITHDFDEAIRLADRIAIMKDGRIIQVATPEKLVLDPATEYVAEFTRHVPRDKVLTIGSIMSADSRGEGEGVLASAKIADVAREIVNSDSPRNVVDADGNWIGSISSRQIIDILVGGNNDAGLK
ncbi:MAG: betaine/proline/choline family ABC transporter ATP-binding protein [Gammaproteobacteria bacterium]|nr:betaine/proline/choline family ABC transporter ATP-binding protein [Gammaproteobacteria bacterium]